MDPQDKLHSESEPIDSPEQEIDATEASIDKPIKKPPYMRLVITLLLAGVVGGYVAMRDKCEADSTGSKEVMAQALESINFYELADKLQKYAGNLDHENKGHLSRVIALLRKNLDGVKVERSKFEKNPTYGAITGISRDYNDKSGTTLTLNESWNPNNGIDIVILAHELLHIADTIDGREILSPENWEKIYGAPGNATEIRTELRAWELTLVLLNEISGGKMDEFYQKLTQTDPSDYESADRTVQQYAQEVVEAVNANESQKKMLKRWLQIYFTYRLHESLGLDCKWTYNFVTQVAGEYHRQGIPLYELDLPPDAMGGYPQQCVYPLQNGPYTTFRPYVDRGNGIIGPASKPIPFNR